MDSAAKILITGRVQGVGFRHFVSRNANNLQLNGMVRNRHDGSVEVEVEGKKGAILAFIRELNIGPRFADVARVDVNWSDFKSNYSTFHINNF